MKNYKIAVAGTGYVGLSLGVLLSQHHQVVAVDIVQAKVDMINNKKSPIQDDYIEIICGKRNCTTISCIEGEHFESLKLNKQAIYVNNGINMAQLQKLVDEVGNSEPHPFTVFTLGRICYQKNPAQFNAIALAMPNIRFLWIGDGELRSTLTAPNITITGWAERKDALKSSVARIESCKTTPNLGTLLNIFQHLGLTLTVSPVNPTV